MYAAGDRFGAHRLFASRHSSLLTCVQRKLCEVLHDMRLGIASVLIGKMKLIAESRGPRLVPLPSST